MTATKASGAQRAAGIPETMFCLKKLKGEAGMDFVDNAPVPSIGPNECLIEVTHAGVCGTDKHIYEWDAWAAGRIPVGITIGHEFVGRVAAVGEACTHRKIGERVSAEGHIACGDCSACRQGNAHICEKVRIIGVDRDGCFAKYISMPEGNCWPVPDQIPDKVAAIFDPLGNAMHTVMAAGVSGKNVLVTGAGAIGLMAVSIAHHAGAASIFVTDVDERRFAVAKQLGADDAFQATKPGWVDEIRKRTGGAGADVLLEMSGNSRALTDGLDALRNGGTAALLGLPSKEVTLDINKLIIFKGVTLLGINGRRMYETWYQVQRFLTAGKINLDPIITNVIPMRDFGKAFQIIKSGECVKIVFDISG